MELIERQIELLTSQSFNLNNNNNNNKQLENKGLEVLKRHRKKRSLSESSSESVDLKTNQKVFFNQNQNQHYLKLNDIDKTFNNYLTEMLNRLVESEQLTVLQVEEIQNLLKLHKLTGKDVFLELEKELLRICQIEYEQVEKNSDRLCGFGWSKIRITTHIKKCLQDKLDQAIEKIQSFI
jgi:hypothetical protein